MESLCLRALISCSGWHGVTPMQQDPDPITVLPQQ